MFINLKSVGLNGNVEVDARVIERLHSLFGSDNPEKIIKEIEHEVEEILENMDADDELNPGVYEKNIVIATEYKNDAFSYDVEELVLKFEVSQFDDVSGVVRLKYHK